MFVHARPQINDHNDGDNITTIINYNNAHKWQPKKSISSSMCMNCFVSKLLWYEFGELLKMRRIIMEITRKNWRLNSVPRFLICLHPLFPMVFLFSIFFLYSTIVHKICLVANCQVIHSWSECTTIAKNEKVWWCQHVYTFFHTNNQIHFFFFGSVTKTISNNRAQ